MTDEENVVDFSQAAEKHRHDKTHQEKEEKVEHIQKVSVENQLEIKSLRTQIAMGKGGLKVLLWLGGIIGTVFALLQGWINFKGG